MVVTVVQIKWMKEDRAGEPDETTTVFVLRAGHTAASSTAAVASAVAAAAKDGAVVVKDGVVRTAHSGANLAGGVVGGAVWWVGNCTKLFVGTVVLVFVAILVIVLLK